MMVIINGAKLDTKDGHRKMNGYPHSQCDGGNHFLEMVTPHHIVMMVIINGATGLMITSANRAGQKKYQCHGTDGLVSLAPLVITVCMSYTVL